MQGMEHRKNDDPVNTAGGAAPSGTTHPLTAILYRSDALTAEGSATDRQILAEARRRNTAVNVTGFLHRESDVFYQWLEGPTAAVRVVFASIANDPRHRNVEKLSEMTITERNFRFWSMGSSETTAMSLFDWAAREGIALHTVRPEQILLFLLHCARRL